MRSYIAINVDNGNSSTCSSVCNTDGMTCYKSFYRADGSIPAYDMGDTIPDNEVGLAVDCGYSFGYRRTCCCN